jgi:hypothetical protein
MMIDNFCINGWADATGGGPTGKLAGSVSPDRSEIILHVTICVPEMTN